jgi:NhaP-type Na+/H+ or K+/H+ antiporter
MTESEAKNMFSPACPVFFFLIMSLALPIPANGQQFMRAESEEEVETEPSTAVLFPWFAEILGVLVFFFMTRYFRLLPFTAIMFLLGTFMGVGAQRLSNENHLTESISQWEKINSEVLLLVFLPGLIFRDAFTLNVRLFSLAINQLVLLAFIMVLAGTCLTALVGFYILPYGWSWSLCMTLGSILAATDPVAVSSLLNEVGAPPRLKIHISGESLLNDGSSYVFFVIFSSLFLAQIGIPGLGEEIDTAQGFAIFFRMALGGTALGLAFGLGLTLILFCLNRRLNVEENVMQVIASITFAYLAYYSAGKQTKLLCS